MDDIAVVICTRNRPPETTHTLNSILAGRSVPDLIIIVDQADPDTPDPLVEFEGRPGILRIHDPGTGLSRARNIGTTAAEAAGVSFVAYTDDDCTVDPGWLAGLAAAFAIDKRVALVFGSTEACVHDAEQGMIPAYSVLKSAVHQGLSAKACVEGMGACMAVRVEAWRQVGGFDEHLGAGTPLAAADDNDLSIRMLWAGLMIAETPAAVVIHAGFRDRHAATRLIAGYMRGSGAAIAKMLRLGQWEAIPPTAAIGRRWLHGRTAVQTGQPLPRRTRLWHFLQGVISGSRFGIDPSTGRFLPFEALADAKPPPLRQWD